MKKENIENIVKNSTVGLIEEGVSSIISTLMWKAVGLILLIGVLTIGGCIAVDVGADIVKEAIK